MTTSRHARILRVLIVLLTLLAVAIGGYGFHKYRKRAIVRQALSAGTAAYDARQWTEAANQLGRYLAARPQDIDILMKYADAQMRRRPQSKSSFQQVASALETVLRIRRGDPKASETLAQFYLAINAPIEAERVARAWKEVHPDDVQASQALGAALIPQQKLDEAAKVLEEVVAAHPERVDAASALAFLRVSHKKLDVQEGLKLLDAAVVANTSPAPARLARARFLMATGQYTKAREDVEAAEKTEPSDLGVLLDLANLLVDMGFYDRASVQFDRAEKASAGNPNVYLVRGRVAMDVGDTEAGARIADRALAAPLGEQRTDVLPLAVELYAAARRPVDARKCIDQLKGTDTPSETVLYLEGLADLAEGKDAEGVTALEEAVKRAPKFARAHLALGRAYVRAGDAKRATASLAEAIRLASGPMLPAQIELAQLYAATGRWTDAARVAREAERQAPLNAQVLLTSIEMQGQAARPAGDHPDPAIILRLSDRVKQLASRVPDDLRLQLLLARVAAWRGQVDEAAVILTALYKDPANKPAASAALSQIYAEAGRYDEAIRECKVALDASGKELQMATRGRLAELYLAAGKTEDAAEAIDQMAAQATGPTRSAILVNMAESLLKSKQPDKARELLGNLLSEDSRDIASRLLLLRMEPAKDTKPSRQDLVDQIKQIEGEGGLNWRIWQARLWLERDDWASQRQNIESMLKECLAKSPNSDEAASLLALLYERDGQAEQALAMYEQAFKASPSDMQLARRLLDVAAQAQQWQKVDQLLSSLPSDEPSLQIHYIGQALRKGDTARAQALLQARVKADPADYRSRLQLASLKRLQNDAAGSQQLLDEATRVAPDAVEVLAARVEYCVSRSEPDQALGLCNEFLARKTQPEVLALRAAVQENSGDLAAARKDLEQMSLVDGWAERGCLALGQLEARHGQADQALQAYRKGVDANPKSVPIRQAMVTVLLAGNKQQQAQGTSLLEDLLKEKPADEGLLTLKAGLKESTNPVEAEAIYEEIIRQHPASARACEQLARLAASRGRRERAIALVDQALSGNPRNVGLLFVKADLLSTDNPARAALVAKDAETVARQMLILQPGNEEAAIALAQAKAMSSGPAQAIVELESFLARKDAAGSLAPRLVLGRLCLATKDAAKAEAVIQQCSSLAPDDPRTVELRLAWHALQKQWDAILPLAEAFRQKHPDDVAVTMTAAQHLQMSPESRHQSSAVSLLELAARQVPTDAYVLGQLGLAYYRVGRVEDAKSTFARGLKARPEYVGLANNLAWIVCEHDKNPQEARKIIGEAAKVDTGTADFASLLDTAGVVEYRLGATGSAAQHLAESRNYLEACLRHPRVEGSTKASATLHLARTLAGLDKPRSQQLLEALSADAAMQKLLSPEDQEEARKLLEQVRTQTSAKAASNVSG